MKNLRNKNAPPSGTVDKYLKSSWDIVLTVYQNLDEITTISDAIDAGTLAKTNHSAVVAPIVTDDSVAGYSVGSLWTDVVLNKTYICVDSTAGAAIWVEITQSAGGDVFKVGTPFINQIGVWTGDGTIKGDPNLIWNGSLLAVTGDISVTGTVDGRDIATDGTKLDGIEAGAQVNDPIEGTAVLSTGEVGGTKFLREDGDGTCSWQTVAGGDVSKVGTPVDDQVGVWTGDGTIEGTTGLTKSATQFKAGNYTFNTDQTVGAGQDNYVLTYDNASGEIGLEAAAGGAGGMTVTQIKTSNYTAGEDEVVPVDSSGGSFTITLPASMGAQKRVIVMDVGKACSINAVTIGRNSQTIDGVAADFVLDQNHGRVDAVADGLGDIVTHLIGTPEVVNINDYATGFGGVNAQTGTSYNFVNTDLAELVTASNAAASAYTISDSFGSVGETLNVLNIGAGTVTISVPGSDTLGSTANDIATGKAATIVKTAATTWWVVGGA